MIHQFWYDQYFFLFLNNIAYFLLSANLKKNIIIRGNCFESYKFWNKITCLLVLINYTKEY